MTRWLVWLSGLWPRWATTSTETHESTGLLYRHQVHTWTSRARCQVRVDGRWYSSWPQNTTWPKKPNLGELTTTCPKCGAHTFLVTIDNQGSGLGYWGMSWWWGGEGQCQRPECWHADYFSDGSP